MRVERPGRIMILLAALLVAAPSPAITRVGVDVVCPVCGTKNRFYDYASWGSYVYQYPSKFQFVFWPYTSSETFYVCSHCHLTLFMWDFRQFPKEKRERIRKALEQLKINTSGDYTRVPMWIKLMIAEKMYEQLGKDQAFWAGFYRVAGYHLARENRPEDASAARSKALALTQKMLADEKNSEKRKELLLISAAMKHFLKDDSGALNDLAAASQFRLVPEGVVKKEAQGHDAYLVQLISEYSDRIEKGSVPPDLKDEP